MNARELVKRVREKRGVIKPPLALAMCAIIDELLANHEAYNQALKSAVRKHPKLPIA